MSETLLLFWSLFYGTIRRRVPSEILYDFLLEHHDIVRVFQEKILSWSQDRICDRVVRLHRSACRLGKALEHIPEWEDWFFPASFDEEDVLCLETGSNRNLCPCRECREYRVPNGVPCPIHGPAREWGCEVPGCWWIMGRLELPMIEDPPVPQEEGEACPF